MSDLEEIRSFVQLVDAGTATRAAEIRGTAVSAVSRRLKDLETRLGVQLLQRTTRKMNLTDEGRLFYDRAVRILSDLAEAEAEVSRQSTVLQGKLKIAAPLSFGVAHLAPALSAFMQAHRDIDVKLDMSDRQVDLVEEGFDLAIRIGDLKDSTLMARRIAPICHVVCAAPAFFETHGTPQHPEELNGLPGLCYGNFPNPSAWSYRGPNGQSGTILVRTRLESTNGDSIREAGIAGLGVLCEPTFILNRAITAGELQPVLLDYRWHDMALYAVYPGTRHVPHRVRAFIDFLVARFGETPYWDCCVETQ